GGPLAGPGGRGLAARAAGRMRPGGVLAARPLPLPDLLRGRGRLAGGDEPVLPRPAPALSRPVPLQPAGLRGAGSLPAVARAARGRAVAVAQRRRLPGGVRLVGAVGGPAGADGSAPGHPVPAGRAAVAEQPGQRPAERAGGRTAATGRDGNCPGPLVA